MLGGTLDLSPPLEARVLQLRLLQCRITVGTPAANCDATGRQKHQSAVHQHESFSKSEGCSKKCFLMILEFRQRRRVEGDKSKFQSKSKAQFSLRALNAIITIMSKLLFLHFLNLKFTQQNRQSCQGH